MKNCTLLRLFFVTIAIPLTLASHSSPSTLKSRTGALTLVDDTNTAQAVPLDPPVPTGEDAPEQRVVPVVDKAVLEQLEALVSGKEYAEVDKVVESMGKGKFMDYLCQAVTTVEEFKGLYGYLNKCKMVPGLLARASMELVKGVIAEPDLLETSFLGECDSVNDAIAMSLKDDNHGRVVDLFEAATERPMWKDRFGWFVHGLFKRYPPKESSMPLRRFLTLHGEEFSKKHPATFETICTGLVWWLGLNLCDSDSQKLLTDFVGQPSLLLPSAFAAVLVVRHMKDENRATFIKYGWREAIEEGLKEQYKSGGTELWRVMKREHPTQFPGEYPSTDEARAAALKDYRPTKQDREEAWIVEHAQNPHVRQRVRELAKYIDERSVALPTVLWLVVAEYATAPTWLDVE